MKSKHGWKSNIRFVLIIHCYFVILLCSVIGIWEFVYQPIFIGEIFGAQVLYLWPIIGVVATMPIYFGGMLIIELIDNYSKVKQTRKQSFLDPTNPAWLGIVKWFVITSSYMSVSYFCINGIVYTIRGIPWPVLPLINLGFSMPAIFSSIILGFVITAPYYFFGMLSLNVVYNIQQIRINTDK